MPKQSNKVAYLEALDKLTPQQRIFVDCRLAGMNRRQSAIKAGYTNPNVHAYTVEKSPAVVHAMQMGRRMAAAKVKITKEDVLQGFKDAVTSAANSQDLVNAWREIGKMIGAYEPEVVKHIHKKEDITEQKLDDMNTRELIELSRGDYWVEDGEDDPMAEKYNKLTEALEPPKEIEYETDVAEVPEPVADSPEGAVPEGQVREVQAEGNPGFT